MGTKDFDLLFSVGNMTHDAFFDQALGFVQVYLQDQIPAAYFLAAQIYLSLA